MSAVMHYACDEAHAEAVRAEIVARAARFAHERFGRPGEFVPGRTPIPASGKVIGAAEIATAVDAVLDGWLTEGRFNAAFEERLAAFLGVAHVRTVNSGSSANLVACATLCSPRLGERALKPGDEVITVAAGFPTTVNPLLLYGLVPVFVDIGLPTFNIRADLIEAAVGPRTRAIVLAHTLGNPFDIDAVLDIARRHDLWVIEDCCDALGATWESEGRMCRVGGFGHIGTVSFYPAHHITTGEGGAVFTRDAELARILESVRDWGRDCWCKPGAENTCGKRFGWQLGDLPCGYDHKYAYSELGFNLKMTDMQAAVGLAQLDRLDGFIALRRVNFARLRERLMSLGLEDRLVLPDATPKSDPSWFGFPVVLREEAGVHRTHLLEYLAERGIGTRLLFGGNLARQPYFAQRRYRVAGDLDTSDRVMRDGLWLGVWPGLTAPMIDYVAETLGHFLGAGF